MRPFASRNASTSAVSSLLSLSSSFPGSYDRLHSGLTLSSPTFTRCTRCITRCRLKMHHNFAHSFTLARHSSWLSVLELSGPRLFSASYGFVISFSINTIHRPSASSLVPNDDRLARLYNHARTLNGLDSGSSNTGWTNPHGPSSCLQQSPDRMVIRHSVFARMFRPRSAIPLFVNNNDAKSSRVSTCSNTLNISSGGRSRMNGRIGASIAIPYLAALASAAVYCPRPLPESSNDLASCILRLAYNCAMASFVCARTDSRSSCFFHCVATWRWVVCTIVRSLARTSGDPPSYVPSLQVGTTCTAGHNFRSTLPIGRLR